MDSGPSRPLNVLVDICIPVIDRKPAAFILFYCVFSIKWHCVWLVYDLMTKKKDLGRHMSKSSQPNYPFNQTLLSPLH